MKISLNEVIKDLERLCEDNVVMIEAIQEYFEKFENRTLKMLNLRDEKIDSRIEEIEQAIWDIEYYSSAMKYVNGGEVLVEDIEIDEEANKVTANVTLLYQMDGKEEKYNNCEYELDKLIKKEK